MKPLSQGASVRRISRIPAQSGFLADLPNGTFPDMADIIRQIRANRTL